jgi:hypothetical protein
VLPAEERGDDVLGVGARRGAVVEPGHGHQLAGVLQSGVDGVGREGRIGDGEQGCVPGAGLAEDRVALDRGSVVPPPVEGSDAALPHQDGDVDRHVERRHPDRAEDVRPLVRRAVEGHGAAEERRGARGDRGHALVAAGVVGEPTADVAIPAAHRDGVGRLADGVDGVEDGDAVELSVAATGVLLRLVGEDQPSVVDVGDGPVVTGVDREDRAHRRKVSSLPTSDR